MKSFSSKRRIAALAVIVLALFIVRPGASRLKSRIIRSISAAVGHPVDIGSVHIRLLPRPGFDLENLVVYDDPAFGAEPMVRASEVSAALRLTSLLRGRMEIARLDLTEPSLNLVHGENGHWNLESLLERSARTGLAPTGQSKSRRGPGFPYIEGTSGRINFKHGPEKKAYALTNADFALWQDSDNSWGVRLTAQPFRTDMNLNDTGLLQLSGTWQRAETLGEIPLQVNLEWSRAQLGQITNLITGNDQGWRGEILLDAVLTGTPAKLHIAGSSSMDNFRRYDITSGKALRLAARCDADYSIETHTFQQLMCSAPVGDGVVTLTGDAGFPGTHQYSLAASADNVPAAALVSLAQRIKKNLPDDLAAEGIIDGNLSLAGDGQSPVTLRGSGRIAGLHLSSLSSNGEFGPESLPFAVVTAPVSNRKDRHPATTMSSTGAFLDVGPISIGGTHPGNATIRGTVDLTGYRFSITGETDIAKPLRLARMAGLPAIASNADGLAQLDLLLAGNWVVPGKGFASPQLTGTAKLHNVHVPERSAGVRAEIVSGEIQLLPDAVHVVRLNANAAGTAWTGSVDLPRGCGTPDACLVHFALNTNQAALGDLQEWLNPNSRKRPWYRVLTIGGETRPAWWTTIRAGGRVTAARFQIHGIDASHVSANLNLEDGKLRIAALTADVLEGKHRGDWTFNFLKTPALCVGAGDLTGISLSAMADLMNDSWIAGTANGSYELKGPCPADFWPSADGKLRVEVTDALFPHVMIHDGAAALQASHIKGQARLHDGEIAITDTHLISPGGSYDLTGTASLKRDVNLTLTRISNGVPEAGYRIGGTLEAPRVTPLSRTEQAQLKP